MRDGGTIMSTLWMVLLRAQRPMGYGEITKELSEVPVGRISGALYHAYRFGYIERFGVEKKYLYYATPRCNVPPGVEVREIMEATA